MKKKNKSRKLVVSLFAVAIVLLTLVAMVPLVISLVVGSGVKTDGVNADKAEPASVDLNGRWKVVQGDARNFTSAGFTFDEILPAEQTTTSGSTNVVSGQATVSQEVLEEASVTVDMTTLTTDKQVRDQNMKSKLFKVDEYPEATFILTEPADLSAVPADGMVGKVTLTGDLTIKGHSERVSSNFDVLRDGDNLIIGGNLGINRTDFGVLTPDFLAAKVSEFGEINVRLTMNKA
nr:YceI family protein [Corynebacterium phocae]